MSSIVLGSVGLPVARPQPTLAWWHRAQAVLLCAGIVLFGLLILRPALGLTLLWNILIPVAPALIVIAPGIWRNVCPMATLSLLPRYLCISHQIIPSRRAAATLAVLAMTALLLIVPLRHLSLNVSGPMSALMLLVAAFVAFGAGIAFEWRSGWCTSLCPIHPVEKLYGFAPAVTVQNARCQSCRKCTLPCPDSTRSMTVLVTPPTKLQRSLGHGLTGGFVGFIWGWFQIPDYPATVGMPEIVAAYLWPFGCAAITLVIYLGLRRRWRISHEKARILPKAFAAAAVSTYYWYRLPALVGFGPHPGSGLLIDLTETLPYWMPWLSQLLTTSFFIWFLLFRPGSRTGWMARPAIES